MEKRCSLCDTTKGIVENKLSVCNSGEWARICQKKKFASSEPNPPDPSNKYGKQNKEFQLNVTFTCHKLSPKSGQADPYER